MTATSPGPRPLSNARARVLMSELLAELDRASGTVHEQRAMLAAEPWRATHHLVRLREAAELVADRADELLLLVPTRSRR